MAKNCIFCNYLNRLTHNYLKGSFSSRSHREWRCGLLAGDKGQANSGLRRPVFSQFFFQLVQKENRTQGRRDVSSQFVAVLCSIKTTVGGQVWKKACHFPALETRDLSATMCVKWCWCSLGRAIYISFRGWPRSSLTNFQGLLLFCFWVLFLFRF